MKKYITVNGQDIPIRSIVSKRVKYARIEIRENMEIVAKRPLWMSENMMDGFIVKKRRWIERALKSFAGKNTLGIPKHTKKEYARYKEKARKTIQERIDYFNSFYGFPYNKVFIRNQKTCWGSCTQRMNLNFNYKLIFLPQEIFDYVIVHEICHLKELNHSEKFWGLVSKAIPHYRRLRKELKNTVA